MMLKVTGMSKNIFLAFFLLFLHKSFCQTSVPIGQWRVHLPYSRLTGLAVSESSVYATSNTGSFRLDKTDNSLEAISKVSGLSDVSISKIRYSEKHQTFILGYEDGNIDLISNNLIINFNDILRSNIVGSKKINHINISGDYAYLSGDYGVSVFNMQKQEIKESYRSLAPGGLGNQVLGSTITTDGDSIFLATAKGVMCAKLAPGINLLDYSNWHTYTSADNIPVSNVSAVCSLNGIVYASVDADGLYYFNGTKWTKSAIAGPAFVAKSMNASGNKILACINSTVYLIESPSVYTTITASDISSPSEAMYDDNGILWVADNGHGLVKYINGNTSVIIPKGPLTNNVFNFCYHNNKLLVMAGGYDNDYGKRFIGDGYFILDQDDEWSYVNSSDAPIPSGYRDLVHASYNPVNNCTYISSYGNGLIVIKPDNNYLFFDAANSPLHADLNGYTMVTSTAVDSDGNTWVVNRNVGLGNQSLHVLSKSNTWKISYVIPGSYSQGVTKITIDDYNNKWINSTLSSLPGLVVFNEKISQPRAVTNLPNAQVNCITKDKKGNIWLGTKTGIAICYNPSEVLKTDVALTIPIYNGFPLLYEREIRCIAVDGGNRKWVGTDNGVWLFNEDATAVVSYFTTDNSPLLSNYILDIGIQENTGEVFFGTDKGIISYRGTATESAAASGVTVFPNPVKPDFRGLVGISGLSTDAIVKITDVYGNLCYQTNAQGGTAVWNVKDYNGNRARSGVYLVFSSSSDGQSTYVAKIAVVE